MEGIVQNTLISLATLPLALNLHTSPVSTTQPGYEMVAPATNSPTYIVVEKDTLLSIAEKYYGDSSFWTVLWNDNDFIEDPNVIEPSWILTLREVKPALPEDLKPALSEKMKSVKAVFVSPKAETSSQAAVLSAAAMGTAGLLNDEQIRFLGTCEAGMIPDRNTGNGYYGAFQFSYGTWKSMGTEYERADLAPLEVQIDAVQRLLQRSSIYTQFPACARKMQSIGLI